MLSRFLLVGFVAVGSSVMIACGADGPTGYADGVFQIAAVDAAPATISCVQSAATRYHLQFNVKLINTTDADITVLNVSSAGVVIRGSRNGDVGHDAQKFDTLSFAGATVVKAHDRSGTALLQVYMEPACGTLAEVPGCTSGPITIGGTVNPNCPATVGGYKDVQANLYVRTTTGEYATKPVVTRVNYAF